jgi:hypothetical protein
MGLAVLSRLTSLLTDQNLSYLDRILNLLVENGPAYSAFWAEFSKDLQGQSAKPAWLALRELRSILRDYRGGK